MDASEYRRRQHEGMMHSTPDPAAFYAAARPLSQAELLNRARERYDGAINAWADLRTEAEADLRFTAPRRRSWLHRILARIGVVRPDTSGQWSDADRADRQQRLTTR